MHNTESIDEPEQMHKADSMVNTTRYGNTESIDSPKQLHITETGSVWDALADAARHGLPIYLYGMGDGADKILQTLSHKGIHISGVYASDEFVRGQSFHGFTVKTLRQVESEHEDFVSVLAFGSNRPDVIAHIQAVAQRHTLFVPDVAVCGFAPDKPFDFDYYNEYKAEFETTYNLFSDEHSRRLFSDVINFKISGKLQYITENTDTLSDIFKSFTLSENEVFVDAGAYDGDSIAAFCAATDDNYEHIFAIEPSAKTFKRLRKNVGDRRNITLLNAAAWSENTDVDFFDSGNRNAGVVSGQATRGETERATLTTAVRIADTVNSATLVKLDVEGAEKQALGGLEPLIKQGVKLVCAVYHRNEDLFKLPLMLHELNPHYRFKLRRINCLPAWDIFLCAETDT